MKFIVYLTTNLQSLVNGINRIYIGVHKTNNPEIFDGYIGCGVYINQPSTYKYPKTPFQCAVKKYGTSAFKRDVLYIYDTVEEAFDKEKEIADMDFINQEHVYNTALGGEGGGFLGKPLYQFDLEGNLLKYWELGIEAYEFYGISRFRFNYAIYDKHPLLNSLWSRTENIDITEYHTQEWGEPKITYLYSINGKCIKEFNSRKECGDYLNTTEARISASIKRDSLIQDKYYVSDKLVDLYIPKARKQYDKTTFYVYKDYKYLTTCVGKELLSILDDFSWSRLRDRLRNQNNWIKDFYISDKFINESEIPPKKVKQGISIDVYTKFGEFIETLDSVKAVKEKYNVHASKIKNIQLGDRYVGDYIFKYHTGKIVNDIV